MMRRARASQVRLHPMFSGCANRFSFGKVAVYAVLAQPRLAAIRTLVDTGSAIFKGDER